MDPEHDQLDTLAKRIRYVRGRISQEEFGQTLDVHRNSIARYEKGLGNPTAEFMKAMCLHYDIRSEWLLLGKGPIKDLVPDKDILKGIAERLEKIIGGQNSMKFAEDNGINPVTLVAYLKGWLSPSVADLLKISKACDVSLEWLLEGKNSYQADRIDVNTLKDIYRKLATVLVRHNFELLPRKKAQILTALYEICAGTGKEINISTIERLLALAPSPYQETYQL